MKKTSLLLAGLAAAPASAGTLTITIPQLKVAEYHRPYVAAWIEPVGGGEARTLLSWYDVKKTGAEPGTKWLHDLRTWWRKGGRSLKQPADGITGATRAPGTHKIALPTNLKPGQYTLYVEAAREQGGREIISLPLNVAAPNGSVSGKTELGVVTLSR
ncbi:DUF2271 domain-containing protein [Sphingobium nicotianae]|uniref:DUF2271 domain-containing protein n=1 Tax=Sphingobium nicotianae TaxID=2782607 RepID=A0A9X1DBD4_9SPHN|nr:DUF2271 domain-containing protein [Sphingobium nicotianae]MBT2186829.1 DUF2271 domain-containing protein [Sphingobium nicotianae]